jgi:hypothetical protein
VSKLRVITGFDGACPFSDEGVSCLEDGSFEVRPMWRPSPGASEEDPAVGGSRFSIKVENGSAEDELFNCFINWEDRGRKRLHYHDCVYILRPGDNGWRMFPAEIEFPGARLTVSLPPGISHIDCSPYYGYGMALEYMREKAGRFGARFSAIGKSAEGREIPLLLIDDPAGWKNKTDMVFMARNHAYETAGSFCAEGMIDFLLSDSDDARYFRAAFRFHFLPMTNPDGAHNGMSRLTAPKGADLNRSIEQDDDAWRAIKSYLDKTRPGMLLNIHNWMSKTEDGLFANTRRFAEKFKSLMPDQTQRGKYWKVEWTELFLEKAGAEVAKKEWSSWKNYVREEFGAVALTLEFPWFGRSPSDMRETGKKALTAFLLAGKS